MTTTRRQRLAFWLVLGLFSTALAEVPSGSLPFAFVTPWGLFVTLPLYLLHAVVLAGVLYRFGRPSLRAILLAGGLFGLYEAYVTKVLWAPTWDPQPLRVGGVYLLETANLVFLWHPVASFLLPLLACELLLTDSRTVASVLPARVRTAPWRSAVVVAVAFGLVQGAILGGGTGTVLLADGITLGVLAAAVVGWRRRVGTGHSLAALLPTDRELAGLGVALAVLYLVTGAVLRVSVLPGLGPQATVWALYLLVGGLLVVELRRGGRPDRSGPAPEVGPIPAVALRPALTLVAVFVAVATVGSLVLLGAVGVLVFLGMYLISILVAVWVVGGGVLGVVRGSSGESGGLAGG